VTPARKRTCDVAEKRHFITARSFSCNNADLNEIDLNEIEYDYVDSKQHFYLQYNVAATDMKQRCNTFSEHSSFFRN